MEVVFQPDFIQIDSFDTLDPVFQLDSFQLDSFYYDNVIIYPVVPEIIPYRPPATSIRWPDDYEEDNLYLNDKIVYLRSGINLKLNTETFYLSSSSKVRLPVERVEKLQEIKSKLQLQTPHYISE
jgi:hypothetical protein